MDWNISACEPLLQVALRGSFATEYMTCEHMTCMLFGVYAAPTHSARDPAPATADSIHVVTAVCSPSG